MARATPAGACRDGLRTRAALFIAGAALGSFRFDSLTQVLSALQMMVLLPVFAAATGALCFADDRADRALEFLLSRPASRMRVWAVKVVVALTVFAAIAALTFGTSVLLGTLLGGPTIEQLAPRTYPPNMRPLGGGGTRTFIIRAISDAFGVNQVATFLAFTVTGPGFLLLLFSASAFWSTLAKRPLQAMFAGLLTALALTAVHLVGALASVQGNSMRLYPTWPLILSLALLLASFVRFQRTEPAAA